MKIMFWPLVMMSDMTKNPRKATFHMHLNVNRVLSDNDLHDLMISNEPLQFELDQGSLY